MKDDECYYSPRSSPQLEMKNVNRVKQRMRSAKEKHDLQIEMTNDINNLSKLHPNARRYSINMISHLLRAFLISTTTCYGIFSFFYQFPVPEQCSHTKNNF